MRNVKKTGMLSFLFIILGCTPPLQYHDFSEEEWVPITDVFQEVYSYEWVDFYQRQQVLVPYSDAEKMALTDGSREFILDDLGGYIFSQSRGLSFRLPQASYDPLYLSEIEFTVIFNHSQSNTELNDGAIRIESLMNDYHFEYDRPYPYQGYAGSPVAVCTSQFDKCSPLNSNNQFWAKEYQSILYNYPKSEDGTYDWSIDELSLHIRGLSYGFYYVRLDEIYVKVVSDTVMPSTNL